MFIHFLCFCPLRLAIMLNFNISKVAYCTDLNEKLLKTDYQRKRCTMTNENQL